MKKTRFLPSLAVALFLCGCQSYVYRVVRPASSSAVVSDRPVTLHYDPLEYRFDRVPGHLSIQIDNPTDERISLLSDGSYVIGPDGESHPLRGRVIGPHSYARFLLPPEPVSFAYPDYEASGWGWGWGWGPYDPFWGPAYASSFWGSPPVSYYHVMTMYDWRWRSGQARLRLSYDRKPGAFEHDFELIREPAK